MRHPRSALIVGLALVSLSCNDDAVGPTGPPAGITDLRASTLYRSTIRLRWTAPRPEHGASPAAQYEIRVSIEQLTGDEWLAVAPVLVVDARQPPGAEETVLVTDLDGGRNYFFVVRSASAQFLWSAWSNVISQPTENLPPIAAFTIGPDSLCPSVPITVDATGSTDFEDGSETLEVRWDWEDDGTWDTDWSTLKKVVHRYTVPDVYTVRLEVRDRVGAIGYVAHRVARGPVFIRSASRIVGHLEEIYNCDPSEPLCYPSPVERERTTNAYGPVTLEYVWTDQTSLVDVDTLRFDGGVQGGIRWPYHWNHVRFDVTIETCVPVDYSLAGRADCDHTVLVVRSASHEYFNLAPCGTVPRDFTATGRLLPGSYRIVASIETETDSRLSFEMVFVAANSNMLDNAR